MTRQDYCEELKSKFYSEVVPDAEWKADECVKICVQSQIDLLNDMHTDMCLDSGITIHALAEIKRKVKWLQEVKSSLESKD